MRMGTKRGKSKMKIEEEEEEEEEVNKHLLLDFFALVRGDGYEF